ncbi:MAG: IS4 family transposase, partial [Methanosarcinales archaeon]
MTFVKALDNKPDLLVRAAWDRCVEHPQSHLWSFMNHQDIRGNLVINVPRKKDKTSRKAILSIRYNCVTIKPPKNRPKKQGLKPLNLWVVYAKEESPPDEVEPISWMLITTIPVKSLDTAIKIINYYTRRWGIEMFFKVLKSGCKIEERQLRDGERLKKCLA